MASSGGIDLRPLPELASGWQQQARDAVYGLHRMRFLVLAALPLMFAAQLILEPVPWKLAALVVTAVFVLVRVTSSVIRMRQGRNTLGALRNDLAMTSVAQTLLVAVTGGIESPLLVSMTVWGVLGGLLFERRVDLLSVGAVPVLGILTFSAMATGSWFPHDQLTFFGLTGTPPSHPAVVWTRAAASLLVMFLAATACTRLRRALISASRETLRVREELLETLVLRNREFLSVSSVIAHELKNPLTSVQGLIQLMARGATPGTKETERLEVLLREVLRMRTSLEEFRNFSRPLSDLALRRTPVEQLLGDVVRLHEGMAERQQTELELEVPGRLEVTCDPQKLRQALVNLVQNGLEACGTGGRVRVSAQTGPGGTLRLEVSDTGPGIDPEAAARLFLVGSTTKEHGTGIGLVVARSIAEQHGGQLELRSAAGGGCVATLTVPLEPPTAPAIDPARVVSG